MRDHWTDHDPLLSSKDWHRVQQDQAHHQLPRAYIAQSMSNLELRRRRLETKRMIITIALLAVAFGFAIWTWWFE